MTVASVRAPVSVPLRVGVLDVLVCGNALLAFFAVVEVPPIPIAPALYLAPLALLAADAPMRRAIAGVTRSRPLQWLTALIALKLSLMLVFQPLSYETFAAFGRYLAAWLGLISATLYAMSAPERFRRLAWTLVLAGGMSALWLLLEVAGVRPFTKIRQALYTDIYVGGSESFAETIRSGLTPFRHQMGYQLAAFIPLGCAVLAGRWSTRMARVTAAVLVVIGLLAVAASLQRSSLVAVLVALVLLAITSGRARTLGSMLAVCALVASVTGAVGLKLNPELAQVAGMTFVEKIQSEEQALDSKFRIQLQVRALELMVEHPLGLAAARVDWAEAGFRHTYHQMRAAPGFYDKPFAVHNGYLVDAVQFGVAFLLLIIAMLWSIGVVVVRTLRTWRAAPAKIGALVLGTAVAIVGMLSFQTLTHNASLTSMEPGSVWLLALLVAGHKLCADGGAAVSARDSAANGEAPR